MIKIKIWIVMVVATVQSTTAQYRDNQIRKYGFSISQFKSESGFESGYELHFNVQPNSKMKVGFGLFIDNETNEFQGLSIMHQRMLFTKKRREPLIQPLVFYNFLYRRSTMPELLESSEGVKNGENWVTYASLEHHIGIGINVNISDRFLINHAWGYGIYLGSIKRPSEPDPITREISGTSGGGFLFKTGISFRF